MDRRELLTATGLVALGLVPGTTAFAQNEALPVPPDTYDVVVVGAGIAGLSAAVAARQEGARKVLVLEKGPIVGGHSVFASGSLAFIDPKRQLEGVEDSIDLFVEDSRAVGGTIDEPMVRKVAEDSSEALDWLEAMGVKLGKIPFTPYGGLRARCLSAQGSAGAKHYIVQLMETAVATGIEVRKLEPVIDLQDQGGYWELTTSPKGRIDQTVFAKAVVLATGGFSANVKMRQEYDETLDASIMTTANPQGRFFEGAEGDGHLLAFNLGAQAVGMQNILLLPYWGGRLLDYAGGEIYVDTTGKRFTDETMATQAIAKVISELPDRTFWVITDSQTAKGANFGTKLAMGGIHKSDSVADMAVAMGIQPAELQKTLDRFNGFVKEGRDIDFGRTLLGQPIIKPPFYWGKERLLVHGTLGGVKTNTHAQVLRAGDSPIEGLFAAGELVGGIWGKDRLGGTALMAGVVQGREAGRNAARVARLR